MITGCSHSGICNIIEYAKKVCGEAKVQGVIGGWHLFKVDDRLEKTIAYLQKHNIRELYPCHCCSFQAKAAVHAQIPVKEIGVGKVIEINWKKYLGIFPEVFLFIFSYSLLLEQNKQ